MGGPAGRRLALAASALLVAAAFALALAGPERGSDGVAAAGPAELAEASEPETSASMVADDEAPAVVEQGEVARVATGDGASRRLVAQVYRVLPSAFLDEAEAEALGLRIVPNSFDNQVPPRGDALFTFPLPGQTPASIIVSEFFAAGFVAGHAQSFESVEAGGPRVGAVAWAFSTEAGAQRAFRALRDLSGRRSVPGAFASISAVAEDGGISELLWVRGRLLLRVASVVPPDGVGEARALGRRLAGEIDERSAEAARSRERRVPQVASLDRVAESLLTLRLPDLDLPGGLNTDPRTLSGAAVFREPSAGVGASGPLLRELTAAGFVAGTVAGRAGGRAAWRELRPDGAAVRRRGRRAPRAARRRRRAARRGADAEHAVRRRLAAARPQRRQLLRPLVGARSAAAAGRRVLERRVPQRPAVRDALAGLLDARATSFTW